MQQTGGMSSYLLTIASVASETGVGEQPGSPNFLPSRRSSFLSTRMPLFHVLLCQNIRWQKRTQYPASNEQDSAAMARFNQRSRRGWSTPRLHHANATHFASELRLSGDRLQTLISGKRQHFAPAPAAFRPR